MSVVPVLGARSASSEAGICGVPLLTLNPFQGLCSFGLGSSAPVGGLPLLGPVIMGPHGQLSPESVRSGHLLLGKLDTQPSPGVSARATQGSSVAVVVQSGRPGSASAGPTGAWLPLAAQRNLPDPTELCGAGTEPRRSSGSPESALGEGQATPPSKAFTRRDAGPES